APGIPCALILFWGKKFMHHSDASRRENVEVCVCDRATSLCKLQAHRGSSSLPLVGRVAHRERSDTMCRVGGCPRERILTSPATPAPLRSGRPSPLKGEG